MCWMGWVRLVRRDIDEYRNNMENPGIALRLEVCMRLVLIAAGISWVHEAYKTLYSISLARYMSGVVDD